MRETTGPAEQGAAVLIVEQDPDCAEAISELLVGARGIRAVVTSRDATLPPGFAPAVILVDAATAHAGPLGIAGTLAELREAAPSAALVVLCIYAEHCSLDLMRLADACLPKDTSAAALRARICELAIERIGGDAGSCSAG